MGLFASIAKAFKRAAPSVNKLSRSVSQVAGSASTIMRAAGVSRSVTRATQKVANVGAATSNATRSTNAGKVTRPSQPLLGQAPGGRRGRVLRP